MTRVTIYADGTEADVAVPAGIPVAALLPHLHDLLTEAGADVRGACMTAASGQRLDLSKSLQDNGISDGGVLVMASAPVRHRTPHALEPAAAPARSAAWLARPESTACTGVTVATSMAVLIGLFVVPDIGLPDVLLGSAAGAVTAVLSGRMCGDCTWWWGALACLTTVWALSALLATVAAAGAATAAVTALLLSLVLLTTVFRIAVSAYRLSEPDGLGPRLAAAQRLITAVATGSGTAGAIAVVTVTLVSPGWASFTLAAVAAAVFALRIRAHPQAVPALALLGASLVSAMSSLVAVQDFSPRTTWWLCAAATTVGALGLRPPRIAMSPWRIRATRMVELSVSAAVVPVCGWVLL